jgi:hypothetical protein
MVFAHPIAKSAAKNYNDRHCRNRQNEERSMHRYFSTLARWLIIVPGVIALLSCTAGPAPAASQQTQAPAANDVLIYTDALASGWQNWSWGNATTVDFSSTAHVHSGTAAAAVDLDAAFAGLSLRVTPAIDPADYESLNFWVYGGAGGTSPSLATQPTDDGAGSQTAAVVAPAGGWTEFTISLSSLGSPTSIARINLMDATGANLPVWYLDDLRLVARDVPPIGTVSLGLDLSGTPNSFIPDQLLGTNFAVWSRDAITNSTFVARTRALGNGLLRIPGGAYSQEYGGINCELGAAAALAGAYPCEGAWLATLTNLLDFLQSTERAGLYTININTTAKEAAATVAFFNAAVGDPTVIGIDQKGVDWKTAGYWAQLRSDHGNPAPIGIKYWDFGNETYGGTQASGGAECAAFGWENVWTCNGTEYINGVGAGAGRHEGYLEFRTAMRSIDPTILVGAIGLPDPAAFTNWSNELLAAGGATIDYYGIHPYSFDEVPDTATILARPQQQWPQIEADLQAAFVAQAGGRAIPIWVTEYNLTSVWSYDTAQQMTRAINALFIADTIGQMITHKMAVGNQWELNGNNQANGTDYGLLRLDESIARSPQYYAYVLWDRFGAQMLPVTNSAAAASQLSVYGGRVDADTVALLAINKTAEPIDSNITLSQAAQAVAVTGGTIDIMQASSLNAQSVTFNTVASPSDDLSNAPALAFTSTGIAPTHTFPAYSVTLLRLNITALDLDQKVFVPLLVRQ